MASKRRIYFLFVLICLSLVIVSHIPSVNSQAPGAPAAPAPPGGDAPKDGGKDPAPKDQPAGGDNQKNPPAGGGDNQKNPPAGGDNQKNPPADNGDNGKGGNDNKAPDNGGGVSRIFYFTLFRFFFCLKGTSCEKLICFRIISIISNILNSKLCLNEIGQLLCSNSGIYYNITFINLSKKKIL
jgi:hypothetical protein